MTPKNRLGQKECCRVESIVSVDERGQILLPKEVRDSAGIRPGDKLALILWKKREEVCCMSLVKVEAFTGMVKGTLGPLMKELI